MTDEELYELACSARERAYAPYSGFSVGAALLAKSGKVYLGCNIENRAFSPSNCAERTAFFKAVSEGERSFVKLAVAGGKAGESPVFCSPCGVCRQVIAEFCAGDFPIVLCEGAAIRTYLLRDLLPHAF